MSLKNDFVLPSSRTELKNTEKHTKEGKSTMKLDKRNDTKNRKHNSEALDCVFAKMEKRNSAFTAFMWILLHGMLEEYYR